WYAAEYYRSSPDRDPLGPSVGDMRVLRGGSWKDPVETVRLTKRWAETPAARKPFVGFRCVLEAIE
ncbi:MAG TPA: SUMF1/EgtB/PvdO family nonheme iron enzyme, partial [Bryobacteraceae bacterium]|nr:SUMF1/EgtB/PvdO family nonheme iron enzyme [Bryobacteraceae bacterium]